MLDNYAPGQSHIDDLWDENEIQAIEEHFDKPFDEVTIEEIKEYNDLEGEL